MKSLTVFNAADEASAIRGLFNSSVSGFIEIGRRLSICRKNIPHGEWESWLSSELNFSVRTAQRYMRIYKQLNKNPELEGGINLSLRKLEHKVRVRSKPTLPKSGLEIVSKPSSENLLNSQRNEIKRLMGVVDSLSSSEIYRKLQLAEVQIVSLEKKVSELEFISSSYSLVRGLIKEQDPEYWFEIVKILGKKKLHLGE